MRCAARGRTAAAYPVGKARLATLGVAGSAAVMLVATHGVCGAAVDDLWAGLARGSPPALDVGPALFGVLVGGTALKAGLFFLGPAGARTAPPGDGEGSTGTGVPQQLRRCHPALPLVDLANSPDAGPYQ